MRWYACPRPPNQCRCGVFCPFNAESCGGCTRALMAIASQNPGRLSALKRPDASFLKTQLSDSGWVLWDRHCPHTVFGTTARELLKGRITQRTAIHRKALHSARPRRESVASMLCPTRTSGFSSRASPSCPSSAPRLGPQPMVPSARHTHSSHHPCSSDLLNDGFSFATRRNKRGRYGDSCSMPRHPTRNCTPQLEHLARAML